MSDQESKQSEEVVPATPDRPAEHGQRDRDRDRGRRRHRNQPRHLEASINMNELRELVDLITENGLTSFELEREGFRVKVGRGTFVEDQSAQAPLLPVMPGQTTAGTAALPGSGKSSAPSAPPHPGAQAEEAASVDQDLHIITSPIVGTFYRSPSPTSDSFVRIGSHVESATVVCIIEAMKLMNEIQAETTGEVVKIYVENSQAVEYGQPLFGIKTQ
jgi:acetyl-CoA carboxylase biotin carboxyl carrier protein